MGNKSLDKDTSKASLIVGTVFSSILAIITCLISLVMLPFGTSTQENQTLFAGITLWLFICIASIIVSWRQYNKNNYDAAQIISFIPTLMVILLIAAGSLIVD